MFVICSLAIFPKPFSGTGSEIDAVQWQWREKIRTFFTQDLEVQWAGFVGLKLVGKEAMKGQLKEVLEAYEFPHLPDPWTGGHLYASPDPGTWLQVGATGHEVSAPLFFGPDLQPNNRCYLKDDAGLHIAEIMCRYRFVDAQIAW